MQLTFESLTLLHPRMTESFPPSPLWWQLAEVRAAVSATSISAISTLGTSSPDYWVERFLLPLSKSQNLNRDLFVSSKL